MRNHVIAIALDLVWCTPIVVVFKEHNADYPMWIAKNQSLHLQGRLCHLLWKVPSVLALPNTTKFNVKTRLEIFICKILVYAIESPLCHILILSYFSVVFSRIPIPITRRRALNGTGGSKSYVQNIFHIFRNVENGIQVYPPRFFRR